MNAIELANELEKCWADPGLQLKAATMLRRQHESIKTLRNKLQEAQRALGCTDYEVCLSIDIAEALKDTEGL